MDEMDPEPTVKAEGNNSFSSSTTSSSVEVELAAKEKTISHLEEMVEEKSTTIKDLEEKLNRQKDYDSVKRELSILRNEINALKTATLASNPSSQHHLLLSSQPNGEAKNPFEMMLLEKTKLLQAENEALKAQTSISSFLPSNVDTFSSIIGEEIANNYAKLFKAQQQQQQHLQSEAEKVAATGHSRSPSRPGSADDAKSSRSDRSPSPSLSGPPTPPMALGPLSLPGLGKGHHNPLSSPSSSSSHLNALSLLNSHHHHIPHGHLTNSSSSSASTPSPIKSTMNPLSSPIGGSNSASLEKLQTCLRQNVERFMNENLNTMNISRCVRELLSVHNIGQRLFAKYVLGLSQGTVSELLSKPKPWDKLTEKGRDSYRKMHAWAADESCIYQLKSLVPRKGKDAAFKQDDPAAEERIQAILQDAQRAMITPRANGSRPPLLSMNGDRMMSMDKPLMGPMVDTDASSENGDIRDDRDMGPASTAAYFRKMMEKAEMKPDMSNPNEVVARLYQEMLGQQVDDSFRHPFDPLRAVAAAASAAGVGPNGIPAPTGDRSQDEIRQALAIYHQEISRLSHLASMQPGTNSDSFARSMAAAAAYGSPMGLPQHLMEQLAASAAVSSGSSGSARDRDESSRRERSSSGHSDQDRNSSAFSLVRPKPEEDVRSSKRFCPSPPTSSSAASTNGPTSGPLGSEDPLSRMQSITNSLLTQAPVTPSPVPSNRPAKAVLPPITQQQFDQYNNLNTEDIVKQVKEQLSQYSISQRLFGESVLGLSQGSVSDLLARPKPWHMLTQKGREPFIRMKMFLEDDGAVHKLVASQYKIAPEKLMRTTGFIAGPSGPNPHNSLPPSMRGLMGKAVSLEGLTKVNLSDLTRQTISPRERDFDDRRSTGSTPDLVPTSLSNSMASVLSGLQSMTGMLQPRLKSREPNNNMSNANTHHMIQSAAEAAARMRPQGMPSLPPSSLGRTSMPYAQPSVYEMAALTQEMDTQLITTKIKETLMAHNIGQKIFGEAVLGLSQGSVSELLSKPKPWHMLSIKGREPFIRMHMWLSDPNNIDRLQSLKNERREANKRRRTDDTPSSGRLPTSRDSPLYNFNSNSSGFSPLSGNNLFSSNSTGFNNNNNHHGSHNGNKKPRILFSDEQKEALRLAYTMDQYPSQTTIDFLATELNLSGRTITNWFHNHRMRLKQVQPTSGPGSEDGQSVNSLGREGAPFDTTSFRIQLAQRLTENRARNLARSDKKAPFDMFGLGTVGNMFGNPNSCSSPGSSTQGDDDMGTLDLSNKLPSQSLNEDSDRSHDSWDDKYDNDSENGMDLRPPVVPVPKTGSSRRKPSVVTSSSSRRKAAPAKWVNPVNEFSDDEEDMENGVNSESEGDDRSTHSPVVNGIIDKKVNPQEEPADDWDDNESLSNDAPLAIKSEA